MSYKLGFGLTATAAIEKLGSNDPSLITCDLSKNAVLQMKGGELIPKLGAALARNTVCQVCAAEPASTRCEFAPLRTAPEC